MQYKSAFEDAIYTATGLTSINYLIYDGDNELIYAGKSVARPGTGECNINVSDIARNYLNSELPETAFSAITINTGTHIEPNAIKMFTLTDAKGNVLETYRFLNCWDYETPFAFIANPGNSYPLSLPANQHRTNNMFVFSSVLNKQNKVATTISTGFLGNYCGNGALYYSNSMGGWDSFLIEGTITKKNSYERYTIGNHWTYGSMKPGTRTLVNTITDSWTLKTHLLTDEESKILCENLFCSNNVYFHSFEDDKIYPVYITDTSVEVKTRINQKKKRFFHTINITSAQPRQII